MGMSQVDFTGKSQPSFAIKAVVWCLGEFNNQRGLV